jgi:hypothetical protein
VSLWRSKLRKIDEDKQEFREDFIKSIYCFNSPKKEGKIAYKKFTLGFKSEKTRIAMLKFHNKIMTKKKRKRMRSSFCI